MKARVSFLHKKESDWAKFSDFCPAPGELVVYDPDENFSYSRMKVGDGKRTLQELDFFINTAINQKLEIIDGGRITEST